MKSIQVDPIVVSMKLPFDNLPPPVAGQAGGVVQFVVQHSGVQLTVTMKATNYRKSWQRGQPGGLAVIKGVLESKNRVINAGLQCMEYSYTKY